MERLKISRNLKPGKYVVLVTGTISIITLFFLYNNSKTAIPCFCFLIISAVLYYLIDNSKTVEFDQVHMFISSKRKKEIVPLANISGIKLTMTQINYDSFWKIKYVDKNGKKSAVRILPRVDTFETFKIILRKLNPTVEIKNWSHSFDFDQ